MRRVLSYLSIAALIGTGAVFVSASATTPTPVTFTVQANASAPTDSGVHVNAGDTVTISATGAASCGGGSYCDSGPAGVGGTCANCWSATSSLGQLVYGIDTSTFVNGGPMLPAGSNLTFIPSKSGELYFAYNDTDYANNIGSYTVTVLDSVWDGGLVQNGSFERVSSAVPAGGFSTIGSGSTLLNQWSVGGAGVDILNTYHSQPGFDGNQYLDLSSSAIGSVSQTLTTVPGALYRISFYESQNTDGTCADDPKRLTAAFGSTQTVATAPAATWSSLNWAQHTFTAYATSGQTPLAFASDNNCAYGPLLDAVNVTLQSLPTPAIFAPRLSLQQALMQYVAGQGIRLTATVEGWTSSGWVALPNLPVSFTVGNIQLCSSSSTHTDGSGNVSCYITTGAQLMQLWLTRAYTVSIPANAGSQAATQVITLPAT